MRTCACLILQVNFWDRPESFLHTSIHIAIDLAVNSFSLSAQDSELIYVTTEHQFALSCLTETHFHVIRFLNQFQEMNDSLVQSCSTDVEAFLSDIDRSVASSHDILCRFDDKYTSVSELEEKDWLEAQEKVCDNAAAPSPTHADGD